MNRGVLLFILALLMLFLPVASAHAQPIICGDPSPVITFIGGGRHLLLSSANTTRIWDARGHEIFVLRNTTLRAVSPDGLTLALQHPDNTIRLWSLDGRQLAVLTGHHSPVATVIYSPDGRLVLTIAAGESARLWHADGRFITTLVLDTDHDMPVAAAFSSDSRRLALAAADTVRLYNREGNRLLTLNAPASPVMSISFGTENNLILAAGCGGVPPWGSAGERIHTSNTPKKQLIDAQLSPDGTHLITTSAQRMTRLWSTQGTLIVSFPGTARFTSDGIQLLTIAAGGDMRLRDLNGWTIISFDGLDGNVADVGFSPDGERLLAMSDRGTLGIWSRDGRQIASALCLGLALRRNACGIYPRRHPCGDYRFWPGTPDLGSRDGESRSAPNDTPSLVAAGMALVSDSAWPFRPVAGRDPHACTSGSQPTYASDGRKDLAGTGCNRCVNIAANRRLCPLYPAGRWSCARPLALACRTRLARRHQYPPLAPWKFTRLVDRVYTG